MFHGCQVLERYILWNGQDRHLTGLDHLSGHASDQIHLFLVLSSGAHHDQRGPILLAEGHDLLLWKALTQRDLIIPLWPGSRRYLLVDPVAQGI